MSDDLDLILPGLVERLGVEGVREYLEVRYEEIERDCGSTIHVEEALWELDGLDLSVT